MVWPAACTAMHWSSLSFIGLLLAACKAIRLFCLVLSGTNPVTECCFAAFRKCPCSPCNSIRHNPNRTSKRFHKGLLGRLSESDSSSQTLPYPETLLKHMRHIRPMNQSIHNNWVLLLCLHSVMGWVHCGLTARQGRSLYYATAGIALLASLLRCHHDYMQLPELRAVDIANIAAVAVEAVVCFLGWVKNSIYRQQGELLCHCKHGGMCMFQDRGRKQSWIRITIQLFDISIAMYLCTCTAARCPVLPQGCLVACSCPRTVARA
jgi:hypothetical protein